MRGGLYAVDFYEVPGKYLGSVLGLTLGQAVKAAREGFFQGEGYPYRYPTAFTCMVHRMDQREVKDDGTSVRRLGQGWIIPGPACNYRY